MRRPRFPFAKLISRLPIAQKAKLVDHALAHITETSYFRLAQLGFRPGGILDIGAYEGNWTRTVANVFQRVPILMIEAQEDKRRALDRVRADVPLVEYALCLLGDKDGAETTFNVMETGSSIYSENSDAPRRECRLTMRTLDAVLQQRPQLSEPLFVKLDVQGAELDVLRGGEAALKLSEIVQLEVAMMNYNAGAPEAIDVFQFMADRGFVVYDICGFVRPSPSYLAQIDVLFVRKESALRRHVFSFS
jgi:FkbM family methyltransferase